MAEAVAIAVDGVVAVREVTVCRPRRRSASALLYSSSIWSGLIHFVMMTSPHLSGSYSSASASISTFFGFSCSIRTSPRRESVKSSRTSKNPREPMMPSANTSLRDPVELVVVTDLHEHLGQGVSDFGGGPSLREV